MFNKLFRKKPQNNNEIRSAVVLKSDIGDFGNYNHNVDGSFYSYQSNNASFSMNPSSPKSIQSDLSPRKIALNQNFCSIFNVPPSNKKNAFFNQVYQTLSNKINKSMELPNLEPKDLSKFDISQESFQLYTSNIKSTYDSYKKIKKLKHFEQHNKANEINCQQSLVDCYKNVPNPFFQEEFLFDEKKFSRKIKVMNEFQDELSDYLDEVELNLSYQIKTHFHEYMDNMINLNKIEVEINEALKNISFLRKYQHGLKKIYTYGKKIIALKIKASNIEKVYDRLLVVKSGQKNYLNIKSENFNAVEKAELLSFFSKYKGSEELYKIVSIRNFKPAFKDFKRKYINEIVKSFNSKSVKCLEKTFLYVKNTGGNEQEPLMDESYYNMTSMNESYFQDYSLSERPDENIRFLWTLPELAPGNMDIKELASSFVQYINIKHTFPFESYSNSTLEILNNLNKKFWKELNECYPDILKFQITELKPNDIQYLINNETNLNFCFKTICFLFQIYKRIFERLIALNNQIVQGILQNKIDSNKSFKIIDGIKITLNSLIEFLLNNIFGTLSQIKPEFLNLSHFRQMNSIFDLIYKWFNKENLKILMSSVKDFIAPDASNYYLESVNSFDQAFDHIPKFKIEREKSFFGAFFKRLLSSLKTSLEDENWVPCDIPYLYIHFVAYICDFQQNNEKDVLGLDFAKSNRITNFLNDTNNFDEDQKENDQTEYNNSPFSIRKELSFSREAKELKNQIGNNSIRIMKNELFIDENKFMAGNSTLFFIKSLYDLLLFIQMSPINSNDIVGKIFELIKFYNSYTCQLILGAGAIHFEKLKTISVKILAFSSLLLSLVGFLSDKICKKIVKLLPSLNLDNEAYKLKNDIYNYLNEINLKIINILNERLINNCESIKSLDWHNKNEKLNIPSKFSAQIIINTKQIYVNIEDFYTKENLKSVFKVVFDDIIKYYFGTFETIKIENKTAASRIKEELEYFFQRLVEIPIFDILEDKKYKIDKLVHSFIKNHCNVYLEMTSIN